MQRLPRWESFVCSCSRYLSWGLARGWPQTLSLDENVQFTVTTRVLNAFWVTQGKFSLAWSCLQTPIQAETSRESDTRNLPAVGPS